MSNRGSNWLKDKAQANPERLLFASKAETLSYGEFASRVKIYSNNLRSPGFEDAPIAGIVGKNSIDYIALVFALWGKGITPVLFNTRWTKDEIERTAKHYSVKRVIKSENSEISIIDFNLTENSGIKESPSEDTAVIIFTSGSTGVPKAVEITFENLYNNFKKVQSLADINEKDTWLASLPFYHIGGFAIITRALLGNNLICVPETLSVEHIADTMEEFKPNLISLVSTAFRRLIETTPRIFNNCKAVFIGGGPVDNSLTEKAVSNGIPVFKVYGSTETTSMVAAANFNDLKLNAAAAVKALGGVKIKIFDEAENVLPPDSVGLIGVKSDTVAKGYYLNEKMWEEKFVKDYFLTGDYGRIDPNGKLYIEMRREDLIVTGGENVNPREVEAAIKTLPDVSDAYVFGAVDDKWGETVSALIETDKNLDTVWLKEKLKEKLAGYKIPKRIAFTSELPKTELGKIDKSKAAEYLELRGSTL